ncbi:MAG: hypothetical protein JWN04_4971 [Myxococcaceae bacterium]|nr:hypothetical protein [Myxococcaceae bacterium]
MLRRPGTPRAASRPGPLKLACTGWRAAAARAVCSHRSLLGKGARSAVCSDHPAPHQGQQTLGSRRETLRRAMPRRPKQTRARPSSNLSKSALRGRSRSSTGALRSAIGEGRYAPCRRIKRASGQIWSRPVPARSRLLRGPAARAARRRGKAEPLSQGIGMIYSLATPWSVAFGGYKMNTCWR